jgi:maltose alpha-D-glucosyltransferase/alpha-amylase
MPSRSALLIATDSYEDTGLDRLEAPAGDAERLAELLRDPEVGAFDDVEILHNEPENRNRRRVGQLLGKRDLRDFILIYIAGHGVKKAGQLYFAAADTELENVEATAMAAEFLNGLVDRCRARRIVMLFDCCYSGAFARGMVPRSGDSVDLEEHLGGTGRAVLTASDATEQAFEAGEPQGEGRSALFTEAIIEGLESGEADVNNDGRISVSELHEFVLNRVRTRNPDQTPKLWQFETEGEMVVAKRRPRELPAPTPVPGDWPEPEPDWFQRAIFYDLEVPSFYDSNGDGIGDLRGLTEKLDYFQWLSVDCLLLSPLFPRLPRGPWLAATDLISVDPELGLVEDLQRLVEEVHQRGLRIVTDLVLGQTSTEHPWFDSSEERRRDWYVWSDTPDRYGDAVAMDGRRPGWTWDGRENAFYWHRRSPEEPTLNFDNPDVQEATLEAIRWWLDLGIDGLRLVGADELFAREDTTCVGLPESHDYLRRIRSEVDVRYPERVLIARIVAWPQKAVEYFGDGEECQMVSNYQLPPALLLALRREEARHVSEALFLTPPIRPDARWATFLREGDPVRVDMTPEENQDALAPSAPELLLGEYAKDPRAHLDGGIRRRLAPLLDNSRLAQELALALLLSTPGSPCIYYGDEIGMGDNVYLDGVEGLRTPMQWTGDRNAGFSLADAQQIARPLISDPVYGYQALNVEAQLRWPHSLLRTLKRMIAVRKEYPQFSVGDVELLRPENPAVLAFIRRRRDDDHVLCVFNLSRRATPAALDLSSYRGMKPIDLIGHDVFPAVDDGPYLLTLSAHGFFWFRLVGEY